MGETFLIAAPSQPASEARLEAVLSLGKSASAGRESFRLLFHAPGRWGHPQGIFRVTQTSLGAFDIFLAPLGPSERGMKLEAIFNFASPTS